MKYIFQLGFICILSFIAEILYVVLPLPIPASVYGLVILFVLLLLKIVKVEQVQDISDFFMAIMPIFFISPSVSLITSIPAIQGSVVPLLLMAFVSAVVTVVVTGLVTQGIIRLLRRIRSKKQSGTEMEQETDEAMRQEKMAE